MILGIDEVGRGPLAGPLVVGAVILPEALPYPRFEWMLGLKDSKKIPAMRREDLSGKILRRARATGLGWVSAAEIDNIGMSEALKLATRRAVKSVQELHEPFSQIIIDGKVNFLKGTKLSKYVSTMPRADDLIREVSAASIIAKVARDHYMYEIASKYPGYGFEKNVGYGTAEHLKAIRELGICDEHRKCFEPIKSMVGFEKPGDKIVVKNTTAIGKKAERAVVKYLEKRGQMVIGQNVKTKFYEIDIVSVDIENMQIFFTEVKYRKNISHGGGFAAIDARKVEKMKFAAECFLKANKNFAEYNPLLTAASVSGDDFKVDDWFVLD